MYTVNSYDICVQGFERLRSNSEFIIPIYVSRGTTVDDIRRYMKDDIQNIMQPDGFDFEACRKTIDEFCDANAKDLERHIDDLEPAGDEDESCMLFVYMTGPGYSE
jgi:hypothetical protein